MSCQGKIRTKRRRNKGIAAQIAAKIKEEMLDQLLLRELLELASELLLELEDLLLQGSLPQA